MISQKLMQVGGSDRYWFTLINPNLSSSIRMGGQVFSTDSQGNIFLTVSQDIGGLGNATLLKVRKSGGVSIVKDLSYSNDRISGLGVNTDSNGNIYICGNFVDPDATFYYYSHLTKFDKDGQLLWSKRIRQLDYTTFTAQRILIDSNDDVFVLADVSARMQVLKFSSSGNFLFESAYVGTSASMLRDADIDSNNNIAVSLNLPNGNGTRNWGILKISGSNGSLWFARSWESNIGSFNTAGGVAFDSSGSIIASGGVDGSLGEQMIVKYNSSGTRLWSQYGSNQSGGFGVSGADVDNSDNFYFSYGHIVGKHLGSDGSQVWRRSLTYNGSELDIVNLEISSGALYIAADVGDNILIGRLPLDGTGTGTYGLIDYSDNSASFTASTGQQIQGTSVSTESLTQTITDITPVLQDETHTQTIYRVKR